MTLETTQVSEGGGYIAISGRGNKIDEVLKEVIDELEAQGAPWNQTQISTSFSANSQSYRYTVIAIIKRHR